MQTHACSHVPRLKDKNIQTDTRTRRDKQAPVHTPHKSILSENTRKHTLGHATHMNEHAEDISINILSSLNSNANICGHCCDELREHFTPHYSVILL